MESLLGPLWLMPYSLNRFPYLTQPYEELNEQDKMTVKEMFDEKLLKYKGGVKAYYRRSKVSK